MKISVSYQCEVLIKLQIIDVGHKPRALQDKRRLSFFTVTVITMSKFIFILHVKVRLKSINKFRELHYENINCL